ncbi:tRNA 4-thiouridine(8) synthase ThiI [Candidatus Kaiserbacteria bacterium]|nr:MAG: tRNA 4-thiouridine(8) synthase ThiI [Candidatus Kaiserbacteria bacterium]
MENVAVVHYDEIALKGANRKMFEGALVSNLEQKISDKQIPFIVSRKWGRLLIEKLDGSHIEELKKILSSTPGVVVFGLGISVEPNKESILEGVRHVAQHIEEDFNTFRITTSRVNKKFELTSNEMNILAGDAVWKILDGKKEVKLKNSDINIRIEILEDVSYIYVKEQGLSGLPVGSSGRAIALLSGGFDSPVATHMCAVRGVRPILMHFHSYPQTSKAAMEKVEELGKVLKEVCGPITLVLVPLLDAQKEIAIVAPERLRVILYRRLMMEAAEKYALKNNAKAIITGEAVGQVASQTLENIGVVDQATSLPILRPLAGMNKREIIDRSREINTHDISVLPHDDTCTVFMPKHPETRAKLKDVIEAEEKYDKESLVAHMLERSEVIKL